MTKRGPLSVAVLLGLSGVPAAQGGDATVHVFWEGSLDAAKARAARIGRPILVAVHRPSEPGSRRMLSEVYPQPEVRSLLRELVCIVACRDATPSLGAGPRAGRSSVFLTVTSEEHQAVEKVVREKYLGDEVAVPQHLFLDADGHLIERREYALPADKFAALLRRMLDRADPAWNPERASKQDQERAEGVATGQSGAVPWAGLFGTDEKLKGETIERLISHPDEQAVRMLFRQAVGAKRAILARLQDQRSAPRLVGIVSEALADPDASIRVEAARTAAVARRAELAEPLMDQLRKEKDDEVARELIDGLATSAAGNAKALQALINAANHEDDMVRTHAFVALGVAGGHSNDVASKMADVLIKKGLKDREGSARSASVWALAEIRSRRAIPAIEKAIRRERQKRRRDFYEQAIQRIEGKDVGDWAQIRRLILREREKK